jgi:hypothetical protein
MSQRIELAIATTVRTSNPTQEIVTTVSEEPSASNIRVEK